MVQTQEKQGNSLVQVGGATVAGVGTGLIVDRVMQGGNRVERLARDFKIDSLPEGMREAVGNSREAVIKGADKGRQILNKLGEVDGAEKITLSTETGQKLLDGTKDIADKLGKVTGEQVGNLTEKLPADKEQATKLLEKAANRLHDKGDSLKKTIGKLGQTTTTQKLGIGAAVIAAAVLTGIALRPKEVPQSRISENERYGQVAQDQAQGMQQG